MILLHNGQTWSDSRVLTQKYIGQFSGNLKEISGASKTVNYYTGQMPQGILLPNGNLFYVYEMYTTSNAYGLPEGYSIGTSIYSKDYDFSNASGIVTSSLYANSLNADEVSSDPRGAADYSGDVLPMSSLISKGTAPDVLQFPSGEIAVSYSVPSKGFLRVALFDGDSVSSDNETDSSTASVPAFLDMISVLSSGWGSIETIDDRSLLAVSTTVDQEAITLKQLRINRSHEAAEYADNANDPEAFFVGSDSMANAWVSFFQTEDDFILSVNYKDETVDESDELMITLEDSDGNQHFITTTSDQVSCDSLKLDANYNTSSNGSSVTVEISINKSQLASDMVRVFLSLQNSDGENVVSDTMGNTVLSDSSGWPVITFSPAEDADIPPEKPDAPKSVSSNCSPNGKLRIVTWSEVPGAAGYLIQYKESQDSDWTTIEADGQSTSISYSAVTRAKYQIRVAAVNRSASGNAEAVSDYRYDVRENAGRYHKSMINPKATTGENSITFSWDQDPSATGYQIIYRRSDQPKATYATVNKNTTLTRTISNLENGTYYVRYRSYVIENGITYYGILSKRNIIELE